ncbi:hypothetical protein BT63DRAFT_429066 [Microthyrium microscopicum]|uniref:Uncharacterized protein n=1 Tax=Microthyrium microscopicum TaxID=703497 RepID=A0A6A6TYF6_9PEZI|nr:hypothetical protein BT63DRAFT_429066 [Microthyrium microscopicum]
MTSSVRRLNNALNYLHPPKYILASLVRLCRQYGASPSEPASSTPSPSSTDEQQVIPNQTFHQRKHGNKPLPLSSFLDPGRISQRQRVRNRLPKPAPPPIADLSTFRQKFARNPYANLLATPPRLCPITATLVPSAMLITLHALPSPNPPHAKILTPLSLYAHLSKTRIPASAPVVYIVPSRSLLASWSELAQVKNASAAATWTRTHAMPPPGLLNAIDELMRRRVERVLGWHLRRGGALVRLRDAPHGMGKTRPGLLEWIMAKLKGRKDDEMPEEGFVALLYFGGRMQRETVTRLEMRVEDIAERTDKAVRRVMVGKIAVGKRVLARGNPKVVYTPVEVPVMEVGGRKVPVLSMVDLLGEERAEEIVKGTRYEGASWVAIRERPAAVDVGALLECAWWFKERVIQGGDVV